MNQQSDQPLVVQIESVLPQTQCGQCGFNGCQPYAQAIAEGEAINRCTPGGNKVIEKLAKLLNRPVEPLHQDHQPKVKPHTVVIREQDCIGCTKCIQACPMNAIIGSAKQMHTVITSDCTGCDLCIPPCPVNCIAINPLPADKTEALLTPERLRHNRDLFIRHQQRLARQSQAKFKIRKQNLAKSLQDKETISPVKTKAKSNLFALKALKVQKRKFERQYTAENNREKKNQLLAIINRLDDKMTQMVVMKKRP